MFLIIIKSVLNFKKIKIFYYSVFFSRGRNHKQMFLIVCYSVINFFLN